MHVYSVNKVIVWIITKRATNKGEKKEAGPSSDELLQKKMRVGQNHKKTERRRVPPLFFLPLIRWPNFYPHITDFGWHEPSKAFTSIRV